MAASESDHAEEPAEETRAVALSPANAMAAELWGSDDPRLMTRRMTAIADEMNAVVEARNLYTNIGGRKHVNIEGWSLVGSMVGVFPHTDSVEVMESGHIDAEDVERQGRNGTYTKRLAAVDGVLAFMATVTIKTPDGRTVGRGMAMCSKREESWRDRDDNQVASMAQTRAAAKAFRLTFGYVMPMSGYAGTPAEEMASIGEQDGGQRGGQQDGGRSREQQGGGQQGDRQGDARPAAGASNVKAPTRPIKNLGGLLSYAAHMYAKQPQDVAAAFNLSVIGDVAKMVADDHGGDWERMVDIMDRGWGEHAEAEKDGEFTEVEPETPEPASEPETPAEAEVVEPAASDPMARAAEASAAGDAVSARAKERRDADGAE